MAVVLSRKSGGGGGSAAPSGPAGGDLAGTYPNPDVAIVDDSVLGSGSPSATTVLLGDRSWEELAVLVAGLDGWVDDSAATWTYASATTFTVSSDLTALFSKGTRIKLTQTTAKYFVVTSSSFGGGNTTVTITGGSDYTLANAAITSPYYSYAANPQGYPTWFNYTATKVGWSSTTTLETRFCVIGNMATVQWYISGTSNSTATSLDCPSGLEPTGNTGIHCFVYTDNGTNAFGRAYFSDSNTITFGVSATSDTWTNSGTKGVWGEWCWPF